MHAPAARAAEIDSINPATEDVIERFQSTPVERIPAMVEQARQAQVSWAAKPVALRCALLSKLGDQLYARRSELADRVTRETGKPLVEALFADVLISIDTAKFYAKRAPKFLRETRVPHHNLAVKAKSGSLHFEPYGVVGIIAPWNYPLAIPLGQIVPALVAGNAVILKGSEITPSCSALIAECFVEAEFPPGIFQVIQGAGALGAALIEAHPDKLIFTGSVETGRRVAAACAEHLIPTVLELGGKDAMIVLDDADLEAASSAAVWSAFTNCGQACLSVERIYAQQGIAERFAQLCVVKARRLKLGPGNDPENEIGPMLRATSVARIESLLQEAQASGAQILTGGRRRPDLGACFFEPTIVANAEASTRLMREEIFGPVVAITSVRTPEEAVAMTNDSPFGLSASIWTNDTDRGGELAARLRVGAVMVNDVGSYFGITEAPHGGRRLSGWGRTHSKIGLLEMIQVKYVDVDRLSHWPKPWWFGYNRDISESAGSFIDLLYAPRWKDRWHSVRGALRALWRSHRI
jgi:acyl-CoA reductase-like NAD-dependent aldehyde dehydrogenase